MVPFCHHHDNQTAKQDMLLLNIVDVVVFDHQKS